MGADQSLPDPPSKEFPYFFLNLRHPDKIIVVYGDKQVLDLIQRNIEQYWPGGIQLEKTRYSTARMFKLRGTPFSRDMNIENSLGLKRLCCNLLTDLRNVGWQLIQSSNLTKETYTTTWFFHKNDLVAPQLRNEKIFCLSISSTDKLQLIGGPLYLRTVLKEVIGNRFQNDAILGNEYEIKIIGKPFDYGSNRDSSIYTRRLILSIVRQFIKHGFKIYGTGNPKGTADCIFFQQSAEENDNEFLMISLNSTDIIRLFDAPQNVVDTVRQAIVEFWPNGIQNGQEFLQDHCSEFKLVGRPWMCDGIPSAEAKRLITQMLQNLLGQGWKIASCIQLSRKSQDKNVFLLTHTSPMLTPHFCLMLSAKDKLKVINAPQHLIHTIETILEMYWPLGIQDKKYLRDLNIHEFKFVGKPWNGELCGHTILAQNLMLMLLESLRSRGWHLVASADVSGKYDDETASRAMTVHNWFIAQIDSAQADIASGISNGACSDEFDRWNTLYSTDLPAPPAYDSTFTSTTEYCSPPSYEDVLNSQR